MPRDPRAEYAWRMHKVLAHIDEHLDRQIALEELADIAHFSAVHFHRVFAAWAGETLGDYQRRCELRRCERTRHGRSFRQNTPARRCKCSPWPELWLRFAP